MFIVYRIGIIRTMFAPALLVAALLAGQTPVPRPFPEPGAASPARPAQPVRPAQPSPEPAPKPVVPAPEPGTASADSTAAPTEAMLGVPLYPGLQFIASYDAGRGQRFYLFGSTAAFEVLVAYYRTLLKQRGDLVFPVPATHEFSLGRFRSETMAFPPSLTIKDYESAVSQGYPNPKLGGQPARFPTIVQIVPAPDTQ
jgi:hypothetical protein